MGHPRTTVFLLPDHMPPLQGSDWCFGYSQGVALGFIILSFQATHPGASQTAYGAVMLQVWAPEKSIGFEDRRPYSQGLRNLGAENPAPEYEYELTEYHRD